MKHEKIFNLRFDWGLYSLNFEEDTEKKINLVLNSDFTYSSHKLYSCT